MWAHGPHADPVVGCSVMTREMSTHCALPHISGQLIFCGVVGAGLSAAQRRRLIEALEIPAAQNITVLQTLPPKLPRMRGRSVPTWSETSSVASSVPQSGIPHGRDFDLTSQA
jgi:hypothetical protein